VRKKKNERIFLALNFFSLALVWIVPNFKVFDSSINYPKQDGDQLIYLSRARAIWDSASIPSKFAQNAGKVDGASSNFENIFFGLPAKMLHETISFKLWLIILVIINFALLLICVWRLTAVTANQNFERALQLTLLLYLPELIFLVKYGQERDAVITKFPFPALHYVLLIETFIILERLIKQSLTLKNCLSFGFLLYFGLQIYFYTWQIQAVISILTWLYFLKQPRKFRYFTLLMVVYFGTSIWHFQQLSTIDESRSSLYFYSIERIEERNVIIPHSLVFIMIMIIYLIKIRDFQYTRITLLIFAVTIILFNQQLLTGIVLQPSHILWYWTYPASGLVIGHILGILLRNLDTRLLTSFAATLIAVPVCFCSITLTHVLVDKKGTIAFDRHINGFAAKRILFSDGGNAEKRLLVETDSRSMWNNIAKFHTFMEPEK
jgi:hypothetical protein